jgi:hypothetical protein
VVDRCLYYTASIRRASDVQVPPIRGSTHAAQRRARAILAAPGHRTDARRTMQTRGTRRAGSADSGARQMLTSCANRRAAATDRTRMTEDHGFDARLAIERAARELIRRYGPADAARIARERAEAGRGGGSDIWRDVADTIERITSGIRAQMGPDGKRPMSAMPIGLSSAAVN